MGRIVLVPFSGTLTNANGNYDLVEVLPNDDQIVRPLGYVLGQTSEVGDAAEENLDVQLIWMAATVTSGSGGSSGTPFYADDPANGPTFTGCEVMNPTVATTSGTTRTLGIPWNERMSPFDFMFPDPRYAPKAAQGHGLFLRMNSTVADDVSISGFLILDVE